MLPKGKLEELKRRRSELAIATHFCGLTFKRIIEGGREYKSARVKALLQKCEWDKRLLKDLEEAVMSLEITEDKIYYQEIVLTSQNETEEVLCVLAKYAVNLLDILLDAKLKIAGLEQEFEDFLEFIYSIEASE